MSSGLAIMPLIFSNGTFCTRRTQSGADALTAGNPFVGMMNMDIAAGQVLKAAECASDMAKESKSTIATGITSAEESIKALSKGDKVLSGAGKVMSFTADHINPLICATGAVKVLTADDKEDAAIREGLGLGTMFAFEGAAKKVLGMPKTVKYDAKKMKIKEDGIYKIKNGAEELLAKKGKYNITDGKKVVILRDSILGTKNPFSEEQCAAVKDFCKTSEFVNKTAKYIPGVLKGLGFVCASIGGYKLGMALADEIIQRKN